MLALLLLACGPAEPPAPDLPEEGVPARRENRTAHIPPACYAETAPTGRNPCFACHVRGRSPNYLNDTDLQVLRAFPRDARTNPWTNLFADRSAAIAEGGVAVEVSNYLDGTRNLLADALPAGWAGWVPDVAYALDAAGFDRDPEGRPTGWRAYRYAPMPGFWPSNGAVGDALIRLPAPFRQADGQDDLDVYALNLAVVEALVTRDPVDVPPQDEAALGVDLDGDGTLGEARQVVPRRGLGYVGDARGLPAAPGLYPEGTELAHSLRYLQVDGDAVGPAPRMRELRYMRKARWLGAGALEEAALAEAREAQAFPDRVEAPQGDGERGMGNGVGWLLSGFIEDADGALRPQTDEETAFCTGCHGGVGVTTDSAFSFSRKLPGEAGWAWQLDPEAAPIPEPVRGDGQGEYRLWLERAGAADDFAANAELADRLLDAQGRVRPEHAEVLAADPLSLMWPSPERAQALNAVVDAVVQEQGFTAGRDPVWGLSDQQAVRSAELDTPTGAVAVGPAWIRVRP
ncbi:MAG: hypothetical protein H6739_08735 [Alphaproteobacteria bacterium]|nr:hypothetical protein [Alphaproteobacteria bacterium]